MSPAIIYTNLTDRLITALCGMLLHSLWQGLLLAATTAVIVIFTKKQRPAVRYNLLIGALLLFVAAAAVTFAVQFNAPAQQPLTSNYTGGAIFQQAGSGQAAATPAGDHIEQQLGDISAALYHYVYANHSTIVLVWFLIICAKCIQFGVGIQGIYLLKRNKVFMVDSSLTDRVKQLAAKMGINQAVTLLESGLAKVPMVVGHLKPVILMPIGLLTALSVEEVNAILVHELAHIRRRDYLANLLQSLAEILFFFNPAVLWVSQLIKTERENCCDDIVLAQTNSKVDYIRALVSCQEYQQAVPAYAMGLPGSKNTLVNRVKRMMSSRNHSLNLFEKGLLTVCLVISGLCLSAFAGKEDIKRAAHAVVTAIKSDKLKKPSANILSNKATRLVAIPASLNDTAKKVKEVNEAKGQQVTVRIDSARSVTNVYTNSQESNSVNTQVNVNAQVNLSLQPNKATAVQPLNGRLNHLNNMAGLSITTDSVKRAKKAPVASPAKVAIVAGPAAAAVAARPANAATSAQAYSASYSDYKDEQANAAKYAGDRKNYEATATKDEDNSARAINEMIKDGLIKSRDNLSFKLSTTELIINNKKQPDHVYQKYKAKYVKASGQGEWAWYYNYDTNKHQETNKVTSASGTDYDSDTIK